MRVSTLIAAAIAALALAGAADAADWRPLDPEQTLVIDTTKGRIVVEMRPEFAPKAVERIKTLARAGFYDGLLFHRVIDHFVDQTGNPNNKDGGASTLPNLPPEFRFRLAPGAFTGVVSASDRTEGLLGATPFAGEAADNAARRPDKLLGAWGAYCPGVAGMGREEALDSANSEIFFMRDASRRLDHDYTVWGRVVSGLGVVRAVNIGEPPADPDRMLKVRVMADLPIAERPRLEVMDTAGPAFAAVVAKTRKAKGADFSVCDVPVAVREAR
jgi:peptidylprolyl isomerase